MGSIDVENVRTYIVSFGTTLNILLTTTFLVIVDGVAQRYAIWTALWVIWCLERCGSWKPLDDIARCVGYVWWLWCTNSMFWTGGDTLSGIGIVLHTIYSLSITFSIWYIDNANVRLPEPIEKWPWRSMYVVSSMWLFLAMPLTDNLLTESPAGAILIRLLFFGVTCVADLLLRVARNEMPLPLLFIGDKIWLLFVMRWCLPLAGVQWMSIAVQLSYLYSKNPLKNKNTPRAAPDDDFESGQRPASPICGEHKHGEPPKPRFTLKRGRYHGGVGGRTVTPDQAERTTDGIAARLIALSSGINSITGK